VQSLAPRAAPQFYTTTAAVRDLEALRQALGGPQLNLLGVSYGTRMAQQYARTYPQAVRSIVLDSPVPNDLVLGSEHARNLEDVLRALAARCRADATCTARFGDPYETLYRVRDRLRAQPHSLELRDPYTFRSLQRPIGAAALAQLMRFYAYNPHTAALIPYVLKEADDGHYAPLLGQAQLVIGDLEDHITGGMSLSVLCAEDVDLLRIRAEDDALLMGNDLTAFLQSACALWPHGTRPPGFREPLRTSVPVLVLAGEHDPVTPPRYAEAIVKPLPRARLLRAVGQGHAVLGAGCMPRLVGDFVRTLDPAALDAHCLDMLGQTPMFLDANGAGP
jgi:pimeloyl-ACP methyl ester carboxylesterase